MILERLSVKNVASSAVGRCTVASVLPVQPVPTPVPATVENDSAIESLRKEFQGLKNDVARLFSASVAASESVPQQVAQKRNQEAKGNTYAGERRELPNALIVLMSFAIGVGKTVISSECQNPENLRKVNMRLLKMNIQRETSQGLSRGTT